MKLNSLSQSFQVGAALGGILSCGLWFTVPAYKAYILAGWTNPYTYLLAVPLGLYLAWKSEQKSA